MTQHKPAHLLEASSTVGRVALHALTTLHANRIKAESIADRSGAVWRRENLTQRLFHAALSQAQSSVPHEIGKFIKAGVSAREIIDICVPAVARKLGDAWLSDTASFGEVTIGCSRLQAVVRQMEREEQTAVITRHAAEKKCLIAVPKGSQHTLGAVVLANQMRRNGHFVRLELGVDTNGIAQLCDGTDLDAVLISASQRESLETLRALVQSARRKNTDAKISIGGTIFDRSSSLVAVTGTDYVTNNWQFAIGLDPPCIAKLS